MPMKARRPSRQTALGMLAVLALVGCKHSTADAARPAPLPRPTASTAVADLRDVDWHLRTLVLDGKPSEVSRYDEVLRVTDDEIGGKGCNAWGGRGTVEPGHLQATEIGSTLVRCSDDNEPEAAIQTLVRQGARWSISDGLLTITDGATTATFSRLVAPTVPTGSGYACGIYTDPNGGVLEAGWRSAPEYTGLTLQQAEARAAAEGIPLRDDGDEATGCRKQPAPPPDISLVRVFLSNDVVVAAARQGR